MATSHTLQISVTKGLAWLEQLRYESLSHCEGGNLAQSLIECFQGLTGPNLVSQEEAAGDQALEITHHRDEDTDTGILLVYT